MPGGGSDACSAGGAGGRAVSLVDGSVTAGPGAGGCDDYREPWWAALVAAHCAEALLTHVLALNLVRSLVVRACVCVLWT